MTHKIPPDGATCQEASPLSHATYIPCGRPATAVVHFPNHGEGPYNMCPACADHNTRRRGAVFVEEEPGQYQTTENSCGVWDIFHTDRPNSIIAVDLTKAGAIETVAKLNRVGK